MAFNTPDWGRILAAAGQGLMQAGQPGANLGNFGTGLMQGAQFYDQGVDRRRARELEDIQLELARQEQEAQRLAETEAANQQRVTQEYINSLPPEQQGFAMAFPDQAGGLIKAQQFPEAKDPESPKTTGGMYWDQSTGTFKPIPGYTEQAEAIARAGRNPAESNLTERQRNALAAGLQPGTPEYQQYILGRDDTAPGPFQGTGLDAQSYNILLTGDPNSPEYKAAYAQLAMPKVTFDPVTQKLVSVAPDMSWARPVAGTAPQTAPSPSETMQLPGATVTSTQGTPIFNETQGKAAGFADRMTEANAIFDEAEVSNAGQNVAQAGLSSIPLVGNFLTSKGRQKFEQAERNFINSQLRRESGAVISPEEFRNARQQYIPQPGDSREVLAQKKANRQSNIESMQREGGPFYKPKATDDNPYSSMSDEEFENAVKKGQGR